MGEKAPEIYQGGDWLTYRWAVAQAFDTLDRIRDLCQHAPQHFGSVLPQLSGSGLPRYDMQDDDMTDMFAGIVELCDDLSGELDAVQAELSPYTHSSITTRWMGFEMRLHLNDMRQAALYEHQSLDPSTTAIDSIAALAARIRDLLKHIDQ
jgi:hypothetical protein